MATIEVFLLLSHYKNKAERKRHAFVCLNLDSTTHWQLHQESYLTSLSLFCSDAHLRLLFKELIVLATYKLLNKHQSLSPPSLAHIDIP